MQERAGDAEAIIALVGFEDRDESMALLERFVARGISINGVTVERGATAPIGEAMMMGLVNGLLIGMRIERSRQDT
jgi:hypothetical protein